MKALMKHTMLGITWFLRYPKHSFKMALDKHPKFIRKTSSLTNDQFGYDLFGLASIEILNRLKE